MGDWLRAHPFTLHVDPLVDHPAYRFIRLRLRLACDGSALPHGLHWFLAAGYCNGMVVEIGRKIRAPEDEERGVETYTAVWGRSSAVLAWLGASAATGIFAVCAASRVAFVLPTIVLVVVLLGGLAVASVRFLRSPAAARAAFFEPASGIWTLLIYLGLGIGPRLGRL